jgi:hypothetical protein
VPVLKDLVCQSFVSIRDTFITQIFRGVHDQLNFEGTDGLILGEAVRHNFSTISTSDA